MQRWNTGAYGWELTGTFDDKLTFRGAESDASEPGSSSFEYLTSATHSTYISLRRCSPGVPQDVRIFSTDEQRSEELEGTVLCFRCSPSVSLLSSGIMLMPRWLLAFLSVSLSALCTSAGDGRDAAIKGFFGQQQQGHTNNWAVLVCTSRYWFNYRVRILG